MAIFAGPKKQFFIHEICIGIGILRYFMSFEWSALIYLTLACMAQKLFKPIFKRLGNLCTRQHIGSDLIMRHKLKQDFGNSSWLNVRFHSGQSTSVVTVSVSNPGFPESETCFFFQLPNLGIKKKTGIAVAFKY